MNGPNFDFELFFEISPDLLCIAGFDGYFKRVNPAVSDLLGYSYEELYSRPVNDFIHPDDRELTVSARENLKRSNPLFHFENRYITRNGEIVWLAWTSQPVKSEELVFAIAKNITHKKTLERERLTLLEKVTMVNDELKQFNLTTSHDLRSPLTNLMTVFDLLDVSKINDPETLQLIKLFKLTGDSLKQSLNNYVDTLSNNNNEKIPSEVVDIEQILNIVLHSIASLIQSSKTTVHPDFSSLKKIHFKKSYLESIFLNLITNAIKYARPGIPPEISFRSEHAEGSHRLIITDNGRGFDMEKVKDKIFGLNQTFHKHEDSKGVGLYLVHSHVTSMGGEIHVESKVNKGTTFIISFRSKLGD